VVDRRVVVARNGTPSAGTVRALAAAPAAAVRLIATRADPPLSAPEQAERDWRRLVEAHKAQKALEIRLSRATA